MDYRRNGEVYQPQAGGFRPMAGAPAPPLPRQAGGPPQRTRVMPMPQGHPAHPGYRPAPPMGPPPQHHYPPAGQPPYPPVRPARRRRRPGRVVLALFAVFLLIVGGIWTYLEVNINRVDALADYPGRPAAGQGTNWLIVGSDSREGLDAEAQRRLRTGDTGGKRTDTIMLAHLPDNSTEPTLLSIPRDLEVDIPGRGRNKVNAAFAFGGAPLLVRTVEQFTGLRIDHYAEIGFGGFAQMVDAIGGVEMNVETAIHDNETGATIPAGRQKLDGAAALAFVRTRKSEATPRSDLDRVVNQRKFIGAFAAELASPGTLLNPLRLFPLVGAIPDALTIDSGDHLHHVLGLGWSMRGISSDTVTTGTIPVTSTSAERIDQAKAQRLFDALRTDKPVTDDMIFR
jgi:LCP family protein required for cell wall assembly